MELNELQKFRCHECKSTRDNFLMPEVHTESTIKTCLVMSEHHWVDLWLGIETKVSFLTLLIK